MGNYRCSIQIDVFMGCLFPKQTQITTICRSVTFSFTSLSAAFENTFVRHIIRKITSGWIFLHIAFRGAFENGFVRHNFPSKKLLFLFDTLSKKLRPVGFTFILFSAVPSKMVFVWHTFVHIGCRRAFKENCFCWQRFPKTRPVGFSVSWLFDAAVPSKMFWLDTPIKKLTPAGLLFSWLFNAAVPSKMFWLDTFIKKWHPVGCSFT